MQNRLWVSESPDPTFDSKKLFGMGIPSCPYFAATPVILILLCYKRAFAAAVGQDGILRGGW
jgi:hypothetical protein